MCHILVIVILLISMKLITVNLMVILKSCVGHVQKRLRTRYSTLRTTLKGKILSDGKKISGRGRLADKVINTMQNYYGMAIRQN